MLLLLAVGSAQVYKLNSKSDKWNLIDKSLNRGGTTNEEDGFGSAVSISNDGTVIAIRAPYTNSYKGSVYIYNFNTITNTIDFIQELTGDSNSDSFGTSVDVSGDGSTIVVGAGSNNGYVKVYHIDDGNNDNDNWSQLGDTISVLPSNRGFGPSVSISNNGNIFAVGAPYPDNGNVEIYQYDKSTQTWINYGNNNDGIDEFGDAISLSADGNIVAISAPEDNKTNCGNNGVNNNTNYCGTVKVFQLNLNTNNWEQLGSNIDGENEDDRSGFYTAVKLSHVKLSDDGMIVAIGSSLNSDNGINSGSVRIFEYDININKWVQISQDIDGAEAYDWFGSSISLSGDGSIVAIGAHRNDGNDDSNTRRGHVRIYSRGGE